MSDRDPDWFQKIAERAEDRIRMTPDDALGPAARRLKAALPPKPFKPYIVKDDTHDGL